MYQYCCRSQCARLRSAWDRSKNHKFHLVRLKIICAEIVLRSKNTNDANIIDTVNHEMDACVFLQHLQFLVHLVCKFESFQIIYVVSTKMERPILWYESLPGLSAFSDVPEPQSSSSIKHSLDSFHWDRSTYVHLPLPSQNQTLGPLRIRLLSLVTAVNVSSSLDTTYESHCLLPRHRLYLPSNLLRLFLLACTFDTHTHYLRT